jgi:hypothetical protein
MSPETREIIRDCLELRRDELAGRLDRMTATSSTTHASIVENVRGELASIEGALAELLKE